MRFEINNSFLYILYNTNVKFESIVDILALPSKVPIITSLETGFIDKDCI